jgi:hypothetical protein
MKTPNDMKPNINGKFSRYGFARIASRHLLALIFLSFALPCLLSAQTLQYEWSFNEPSGSATAIDSVAGANITLLGSTSLGGGVLTLPGGGGNYAQFPNGILSTNNSITIETWLTDNQGQTWSRAYSFGGSTTGPNNNFIQDNYIDLCPHDGPGVVRAEWKHGGSNPAALGTSPLPTGSEQYVVQTYDATSQTLRLYVNGVQVGIATGVTITPASLGFTYNNYIGLDQWNDPVFNGTFDEMRIWTAPVSQRYLSASTVAGPGVVINNLSPTSASLTAGPGVVVTGTEQATFTVTLPQTGSSVLLATSDATNWISSNPAVLTVSSSGLITGVGAGSATISATVAGVTATSGTIIVAPQTLLHRYSFASDASDSVGGANGTLVAPNGGNAATISSGLILPGNTQGGYGYSGYVSLPSGILTNTTSVTVECWATQNQGNGWATIWDFANNNNVNFGFIPFPQNNNGNMEVAVNPNNNDIYTASSVSFPNGPTPTQYVSFTFDNSALVGKLYTNGTLIATQSYPDQTYSPGNIGGAGGTTANALGNDIYGDWQFSGTVYEFRIWNGAVSPAYLAASTVAGPSIVVTNTTPQSLAVSVTTSMIGSQTQQAIVTGSFLQVANVRLTGAATNWISSNPSVLTVNSSGLITAVNGGSATVSATVNGVTAVSASITVSSTFPTVPVMPANQTVVVNDNASFSVQALGGSLSYQWSFNSTPITGATNPTLNLTNVNYNQAGTYSVLISNTIGSTNVSAVLTVSQPVLLHRYSFVSDASDSVGGANGTVVPPNGGTAATIANGLVLPGGGGGGYSGYVTLPSGILTNTTSLTVECWATQAAANQWATIWDFANNNNVTFGLIPNPNPAVENGGNMVVAVNPNNNDIYTTSGVTFPNNSEQYVAYTFNNGNLVANLYTNGTLVGTQAYPNNSYTPANIGGAGGTTVNALGNDIYGDAQFQGTVYEFRIWHGAVSPLYLAVSAAAGPSVVVTSLTPTAVHISVNTSQVGGQTQQASATADFTGISGVPVTGAVTNWISSNTSVLTVNSNGVITAGNVGSATVSATLNGVTGTSSLIRVSTSGPIITQQPTPSVTLLAGATLTASVANIGTAPFVYYWYTNLATAPISVSGSPTLTLPNVQAINSGTYTCVVSNQYSTATSSTLSLTVVTPTTYQGVMVSLKPLGYWPLNENDGTTAYDVIGGNNGTYTLSSVIGSSVSLGQPGPTDSFFGGTSSAQFLSAYVDIPEGPFNLNGAITIMGWVQIQVASGFGNLIGHGDSSYRISIAGDSSQVGANDGLASFSTNNPFGDATAPTGINDGNWHLVAYTYTGNTAQTNNGTLYVDGVPEAGNTIVTNSVDNHLDVWIGGAPDYGAARLLPGANIANVAVFNRALTAAQIQGINTGVYVPNPSQAIGISRSGSSVVLTWTSGTLLQAPTLTGPWTTNNAAVSPYTVPATSGKLFFKTVQ